MPIDLVILATIALIAGWQMLTHGTYYAIPDRLLFALCLIASFLMVLGGVFGAIHP